MPDNGLNLLHPKLLSVLERAERDCTELILEAVRTRSQSGIELTGEVTVKIREIADWLTANQRKPEPRVALSSSTSGTKTARRAQKREYPRFHISENNLVKTGWSKKSKKEYVHKVPHDVYKQVLDVISTCATKSNGPIPSEDIVGAANGPNPAIPGYQVYLVLGFLRDRGVLEKDGRRGFIVLRDVREAGIEAWRETSGKH